MNININNVEKLTSALHLVQSRSRTRTVDIEEINRLINELEDRFYTLGVALSNVSKAEFLFENGHKMPNAYRGQPESTQLRLKRGSRDWFVTDIYRDNCNHNRGFKFLNEDQYRQFYKFT